MDLNTPETFGYAVQTNPDGKQLSQPSEPPIAQELATIEETSGPEAAQMRENEIVASGLLEKYPNALREILLSDG
jgi:hypothetical protein